MTPTLTRGYTFWDRAILPPDEFEERVRTLQVQMREDGLVALLNMSNTYHCSGDLAYIAGWPIGGTLVTLPEGEPRMYTHGGGRELFFQRAQIWLASMKSLGAKFGKGLRAELAEQGVTGGKVGVVGLDLVPSEVYDQVMVALEGFDITAYDATFHSLRQVKRVREQRAIATALEIARQAMRAAADRFENSGDPAAALVAAEYAARSAGALDFRGLANTTGAGLRPFEGISATRQNKLLLWGAVNVHGYWADIALDTGAPGKAQASVAAMARAASAGAPVSAVAAAGLACLPQDIWPEVLSYGLGGGIGQDLHEDPVIRPDGDAVLSAGMVLSLRSFVPGPDGGSLASLLVRVGQGAATPLV